MAKVLVAGSTGLVGSSVVNCLKESSNEVLEIHSAVCDLRSYEITKELIGSFQPEVVIDAAARVGGIHYNDRFPVQFLIDNTTIQNNLMQISHEFSVKRFIFLGSSCVYPKYAPQPIREESLLSGKLESTNSAYAVAKISGIELVKSFRKQYGHDWITLMPTNVYGPGDNFDEGKAHVIPALIARMYRAVQNRDKEVKVWGLPTTLREFIFVDDLADAILFCQEHYHNSLQLNIGVGSEIRMDELATKIALQIGFEGKIVFDSGYPAGTPRKLLDSRRIFELGWRPKVTLDDGLRITIEHYRAMCEGNT